ncbi:hypothetical protein FACS1894124_6290 [Spirochaetia bacterium]|nr:hypothetical protein FACS1894124_6290 [Spirochaetia bacterium]
MVLLRHRALALRTKAHQYRLCLTGLQSVLIIAVSIFLGSCGIEDYLFLEQIPAAYIQSTQNNRAVIQLPANLSASANFTHFAIYYRIYISDMLELATINTPGQMSAINSYLTTDYTGLESSTKEDTTVPVTNNISSLFSGRKYFTLNLEEANIEDVLGSSVREITFEFDQTTPVLIINGSTRYTLKRSNGSGAFQPEPEERLFINDRDLYASENAVAAVNNDVANKASIPETPRYTYASLYIVVTGIDSNITPIFSRPTHIGIFRLPD